MHRIKQHLRKYALFYAGLFSAITIALSVLPARDLESTGIIDIPHIDKIGHLIAYATVSFFWTITLDRTARYIFKSFVLVLLIGLTLEMVQFYFLEGRYFEIFDIIANISGILIGLLVYKVFMKNESV